MRGLFLTSSIVFVLSFVCGFAEAGSRVIQVTPAAEVPAGFETYKGYIYDLSENVDRKDKAEIVELLKKQLDIVENAGLSPKVMQFLRTVPIVASEMGCTEMGPPIACYGSVPPDSSARNRTFTVWDSNSMSWSNPNFMDLAADAGTGVIKFRPNMLKYAEDPVMLHEMLHAYHAKLMGGGLENLGIKAMYAQAVSKNIWPKEEYAMSNPQEFFAVTASVFLAGKESIHEPKTRAALKEKMPKYYKFLVELFGFDPEPAATPVAEAPKQEAPAQTAATAANGT
ncbi:MAG TPA: hypothetical protein VFL62_02415 [Bradyrhizobium sp.]|uniref:hypothetical protein n=1 Tax=Bradyrhizobium sp. TaxID=376 RepID=UPI002D7FD515|nr:hypothetical protein [Bradyrhizobium sp.]HET7885059.1 hypothetical protein [Bradyrhizobium sp.]